MTAKLFTSYKYAKITTIPTNSFTTPCFQFFRLKIPTKVL